MADNSKGGKKNRKYGRAARKPKTARYKNGRFYEKNKLKRILRSNGVKAALAWATDHDARIVLERLMR